MEYVLRLAWTDMRLLAWIYTSVHFGYEPNEAKAM